VTNLLESQRKLFISGLHNIPLTGITNIDIMRAGEDFQAKNPFIVVSFLPLPEKYSVVHNYYLGANGEYSWYGYGQQEKIIIRTFAKDYSWIKGRDLVEAWNNEIETYLKVNWRNIITGASLDRTPMPHKDIGKDFINKYYGSELSMVVNSMNIWTDRPSVGALTGVEISGVKFKENKLWYDS